jgi:hypothetical protein
VVLVQVLALLLRLGPEGGEALHTGGQKKARGQSPVATLDTQAE